MVTREESGVFESLILDEMTRTERVMAAVNGEPVDRPPVCFWHHFQPEGSGRALADATLRFFDEEFDLDIAKVMPDLPYPFPRHAIHTVNDWRLVEPIDPRSRYMTQRAETVRMLRDELGYDTPIVVTVFSPLAEAMYAAADRETFMAHLQEAPVAVHGALATIAENLRAHIQDVIAAGADGVFFSLQGCTGTMLGEEQYREFGRPYDLFALQGALDGWLNVLHIHGEKDLFFELPLDYPVQALSWSDRLAGPSLREARMLTSKCLMGGWNEFGPLSNGPEEAIRAEAEDAVAQTSGRKLILANGCSVPDDTDPRWLHAARDIVDELELPS
ncbi:MAG: uroporphyrinogen decarboxylase [Thermomicrobiales bacterium]|nr:uroporphyrinogen decarboxylase [Thermomicrobiales bacterium]